MKYFRISLVLLIALTLSGSAIFTVRVSYASQGQSTALERGYRTGYSDGYSTGSRDVADKGGRDYRNSGDYQRADRNYNEAWGTIEDYRDGYQQGFEAGYNAGYDRRPFESSIPTGLSRRGGVTSQNNEPAEPAQSTTQTTPPNNSTDAGQPAVGPPSGPLSSPRDALFLVELESGLSTDASQRGDRFQARVIEPREFSGAIIDGRVTRVKRSGKVKGTAELQLAFEAIHLPDGRTTGFNADVVEIIDNGNRDDAGTVDSEGGVRGRSSTKDDISKVGASTGIGAIIGAVIGGGKGAAIGAAIGGAAGTSSVLSKRGEDVRLARGQQLRIRTTTDTRIQ
ncbi:MAG TPA: hypothetical protein VMZ30_10220 [Pyrinomonadaceae bacterium]|nr:hypothetical protein [Pyrinomonadaceae bacterium]